MADDPPDPELVRRVQAGDVDAFAPLAARHATRLVRFLATMTGDDATAEDLAQETLLRAQTKLAQLRDPTRFGSWLLSIACNRCRSHLRAEVQRQRSATVDPDALATGRRSALSSLVRAEDAVHLGLAIDRLPILLREAFVLFAVEGLPYAEIASATEVAEGTLMVRVHRAKALLRQQLGPRVDTWWSRDDGGGH